MPFRVNWEQHPETAWVTVPLLSQVRFTPNAPTVSVDVEPAVVVSRVPATVASIVPPVQFSKPPFGMVIAPLPVSVPPDNARFLTVMLLFSVAVPVLWVSVPDPWVRSITPPLRLIVLLRMIAVPAPEMSASGMRVRSSMPELEVMLTASAMSTLLLACRIKVVDVAPVLVRFPLTVTFPVAIRLTLPSVLIVLAGIVMLPVLLTDTAPPPAWLIPVTDRVATVLVRLMAPLVLLVALKLVIALLALPRLIPVAAVAVRVPAVTSPVDSTIEPAVAVRVALLVLAFTPYTALAMSRLPVNTVRLIGLLLVLTPFPESTVPTISAAELVKLNPVPLLPAQPERVPTLLEALLSITVPKSAYACKNETDIGAVCVMSPA